MILRAMFSRQWILTTLLVLAGAAFCARMGIWQLDRLEQRRAFNHQVESMRVMDVLDLNVSIPEDIAAMEYRAVIARGTYDFENQGALLNHYHQGQPGYHLLTPLLLDNEPATAILVDRGWIPLAGNDSPSGWGRYDERGQVEVRGVIRLGEAKAQIGGIPDPTLAPGQTRLDYWYVANLARISKQIPYGVLPVYIQPDVDPDDEQPPMPFQEEIELTEGPHLGYAGQWFTFATILLAGYPFYLRKQLGDEK
ncbi:MAG: SURF1 family protein [Anaerolineales bacterium]